MFEYCHRWPSTVSVRRDIVRRSLTVIVVCSRRSRESLLQLLMQPQLVRRLRVCDAHHGVGGHLGSTAGTAARPVAHLEVHRLAQLLHRLRRRHCASICYAIRAMRIGSRVAGVAGLGHWQAVPTARGVVHQDGGSVGRRGTIAVRGDVVGACGEKTVGASVIVKGLVV